MTNRENYISIIKRKGYEKMPAAFSWCDHLKKNFSQNLQDMRDKGEVSWEPVAYAKGMPCNSFPPETYKKYYQNLKEGAQIDIYGVAHEPGSEAAMHMTYMRHPMQSFETVEEMEAYPFPEFYETTELIDEYSRINASYKAEDKIVMGNMQCTIWEDSWYIRGMEVLMMDMMSDEDTATWILDKITGQAIKRACFYAKTGADAIFLGDDIGMQHSIMMSDELYSKWIKPRLKKVIDAAREINPELIVFYHSCGFVEPLIEHLIEAGIDVLNPVQPECMDFAEIHAKYGDRLSFHGTVGTQTTMPFGTPEQVKETVMQNLKIAGKKGGLLVCPTHLLEPEVPWENIKAYVEACRDFKIE